MSDEDLVQIAIKRREVFDNLDKYLETIKGTVQEIDPNAEIYIFGSVPNKNYTYSSDIDVLIVTRIDPDKIRLELWQSGIREPFEFHIHPPKAARIKGNLVRVA
jgi:hypothetical protein